MGRWTNCKCGECSPSNELREILASTVSAAPNRWRFEVYTEGHNYLMRNLKDAGDWAVGAFIETNNPTILKLVIVSKEGKDYYLKVKAEHNKCPFESDNRFSEQLWLMVDEFWEHYRELTHDNETGFVPLSGVFGNDWVYAKTRRDAKSSCSVMRSGNRWPHEDGTPRPVNQEHSTDDIGVATDWLLEAIDSIDEYGWFAE